MRKGRKKGLDMGWLCSNAVRVEKYYLATILMWKNIFGLAL